MLGGFRFESVVVGRSLCSHYTGQPKDIRYSMITYPICELSTLEINRRGVSLRHRNRAENNRSYV